MTKNQGCISSSNAADYHRKKSMRWAWWSWKAAKSKIWIRSLSCTWEMSCEALLCLLPWSITEGENSPLAGTAWQMVAITRLKWFPCKTNFNKNDMVMISTVKNLYAFCSNHRLTIIRAISTPVQRWVTVKAPWHWRLVSQWSWIPLCSAIH